MSSATSAATSTDPTSLGTPPRQLQQQEGKRDKLLNNNGGDGDGTIPAAATAPAVGANAADIDAEKMALTTTAKTIDNDANAAITAGERANLLQPLGREELDKYRRDPFWKGIRFALIGTLLVLFLCLITAAILIITLSGDCAPTPLPESAPLGNEMMVTNGTSSTTIDITTTTTTVAEQTENDHEILPMVRPKHLTVLQGDPVQFHCEFSGPVQWWRVNEAEGEENSRGGISYLPIGLEQREKDGTLQTVGTRGGADISHRGLYVCVAFDHQRGGTVRSDAVQLDVMFPEPVVVVPIGQQQMEVPMPTTITTTTTTLTTTTITDTAAAIASQTTTTMPKFAPPANRPRVDSYLMIASTGDPVHFRCWQCQFAQCQSGAKLYWRKLEPDVVQQADLSVERDEKSAFLIFRSVQPSEAGLYECLDLDTGIPSSAVHLQVEPARTPMIHPLHQSIPVNAPASFHCVVPGHSDAQLSWRLENGVEANRLYGVEDDGHGTLQIGAARPDHERHGFVCWAVYPRRAQALHAGPVKIELIRREDDEATEEKERKKKEEEVENGEMAAARMAQKIVEESIGEELEEKQQQQEEQATPNKIDLNAVEVIDKEEEEAEEEGSGEEAQANKQEENIRGYTDFEAAEEEEKKSERSIAGKIADEAMVQVEALLDNIANLGGEGVEKDGTVNGRNGTEEGE